MTQKPSTREAAAAEKSSSRQKMRDPTTAAEGTRPRGSTLTAVRLLIGVLAAVLIEFAPLAVVQSRGGYNVRIESPRRFDKVLSSRTWNFGVSRLSAWLARRQTSMTLSAETMLQLVKAKRAR